MIAVLNNIAVIGCCGSIGAAFVRQLAARYPHAHVHALSRQVPSNKLPDVSYHPIDYASEASLQAAASIVASAAPLDLVIVATGILHDDVVMPEKSLKALSAEKFQRLFAANSITPALIAKHFIPKLNKTAPATFAALSARVGSISDNRLGGWYAYRASKAALNMIIRTAAIETARTNKQAVVVSLHPGTVDSELSRPFQGNLAEGQLLTPDYAAACMLDVLSQLTPSHSGLCFAFDGEEVLP